MQLFGKCLVAVADGEHARLFEERRRGGALTERSAWVEDLRPGGHIAAHPKGRVFQRVGPGSHTGEATPPHDRAEARFLQSLARRIDELVSSEGFDEIILIAPPRALGVLREALAAPSRKRLAASEAALRCNETPAALRTTIRQLRNAA